MTLKKQVEGLEVSTVCKSKSKKIKISLLQTMEAHRVARG
jgi:hypothetical protein